jgi:hypothetical protein
MIGWLARARSLAWLAIAILLLLTVAYIAALVVDSVEIAAPLIPSGDVCAPRQGLALITAPSSELGACPWQRVAFKTLRSRTVVLKINETASGRFEANVMVTTSPKDPLVAMVRRGDARQHAAAFAESVVGSLGVDNQPFEWSVPVLVEGQHPGKVLITASAAELPLPGNTHKSTSPVTLQAALTSPGTVQLASHAHVVAGAQVRGTFTITREDAHSVMAATRVSGTGGQLTVDLTSDAAQSLPYSISPAAPGWLARSATGAWQILRGFAESIFPAGAWIVLFLANRAGAFGSVGRRESWQRAEWTIGMVLLAHFVISAAVQISNLESLAFPGSLALGKLEPAMTRAGLWFPSGYAAVNGGVVLLVALIICAAGWWGRPQYASFRTPGRLFSIATAAAGIAFAVLAFVGLAREGQMQFFRPQFHEARVISTLPLATEIPVAALSALACAGLAAAWLSGALALSKASPGKRSLTGPTAAVNAVAIGLVGRRALVVSGSTDHTVRIWDAASGAPVGEPLTGHTAAVNAVAIGLVGRRALVVSGSTDHTVRIWDAASGAPVGEPLTGHTAAVNAVAGHRLDGRTLVVSGSSDGTTSIGETGPHREQVLRRLIAVTAPVVLVGLGFAAAFVRHGGPLKADVLTLWVTGVLSIAIAVTALAAWLGLRPKQASRTGPEVRAVLIFAATLALSIAASYLIITRFMNANPATPPTADVFEALIALAVVAVTGTLAAIWPWRLRRGVRPAQLIAFIAVLAVAATATNDGGYGPLALRWGVLIIVGAVMGLAVVRLAAEGIGWQPIRLRYLLALLPVAALVAVPWGILHSQNVTIGWWTLLAYAFRIDGVLVLVLVAALVTALRRLGSAPVTAHAELRDHRALGMAIWFIALSGTYTLAGGYSAAAVVFLGVAGFGAWLLMPTDQVVRAADVLGQSTKMQAHAVARTLRTGAGRRLIPSLSKAMQDKAAAGDMTLLQTQNKVMALERQAVDRYDQLHVDGHVIRVTTQQRGFGALTSSHPWQRASWGALAGFVIGSPWVVLALVGISLPTAQDGYPVLRLGAAVAPVILRWAGYGFLFGYFFPLLRGATGLRKAIWLFVVAAAAEVCVTLTSAHTTVRQWDKTGLLIIQLFAFAMTLGILADRAVLHKYHFPTARLLDLHNLWTVSAWASSVGVAVATGIATVIIVGLQPFAIGVITPSSPTPPSPPAVTVSPP